MRRTVSRVCPGPETLSLLFGATIGAAINLLTALALNGAHGSAHSRAVVAGWLLLAASCAVGLMAVLVSGKRSEVLDGIGATLSVVERRALLRQQLEKIAPLIGLLSLSWVGSVVYAMLLLTG